MSENHYTIGVKLNYDTVLCSYRTGEGTDGLLDRTGGFGSIEVPFKLAHRIESDEWLVGEDVNAMDFGSDELFEDLLSRELEGVNGDSSKNPRTRSVLIGYFVREVIGYIKQLNPKAVLEQLRITFPEDYPQSDIDKITLEVNTLIDAEVRVITDLTSGVSYVRGITDETVVWVDFDEEGLTSWLLPKGEALGNQRLLRINDLSVGHFTHQIESMVQDMYLQHISNERLTIEEGLIVGAVCRTYLPFVFSKTLEKKPLKLTFNQCYPPFQNTLSWTHLKELAEPYMETFEEAISGLVESHKGLQFICTGSGFRFHWAQQTIKKHLKDRGHIRWEGVALGRVSETLFVHASPIPCKSEKVFGIMVDQGNNQCFCKLIEGEESLSDGKTSVIMMVPEWQQEVQLLCKEGTGELTIAARGTVPTIGKASMQRVRLDVTFDGEGNFQLHLEKLSL